MYPLLILHLLLAAPAAAALMRQERTPVSALAWLLAILLVPAAGSILYLPHRPAKKLCACSSSHGACYSDLTLAAHIRS